MGRTDIKRDGEGGIVISISHLGSFPLRLPGISSTWEPSQVEDRLNELVARLQGHFPPWVLRELAQVTALVARGDWAQSPNAAWTAAARLIEAGWRALPPAAQLGGREIEIRRETAVFRHKLLAEAVDPAAFGGEDKLARLVAQARRDVEAVPQVRFTNLTPHAVHLIGPRGENQEIPPSGVAPRVPIRREDVGTVGGVPVRRTRLDVEAADPVPDPEPGIVYIVARVVAEAHPDRDDLLFPDELVRDDAGRVVGCRSLGTVGQ